MNTPTELAQTSQLQEQIDAQRMQIRTDSYTMSISEWASLYESDEIDIHPKFQRFFRWTPFQKSRLIESIMLGIPIPPIFVSQRADGVWDVVDGLQRLSTIYEFMGILKDAQGDRKPKLQLEKPNLLTALEGKMWDEESDAPEYLTPQQQLLIKRAKISVNIILRESDPNTKYELFNRLNTGGTQLSDQEVRNSILVMLNPELYESMNELATNEKFREIVALTDRALEERYDLDLITRFFVFRTMRAEDLKQVGDLNDFMTVQIQKIAGDPTFDLQQAKEAFERTVELLQSQLSNESFKKYDPSRNKFLGGFTVSAFEGVALGIAYHYPHILTVLTQELKDRCVRMWSSPEFVNHTGAGIGASRRVLYTIPIGRDIFQAVNIRTTNKLYDFLSEELAWRKKELTDLKFLIDERNLSKSKRSVLLRSGIALLYAHWEGFVKAAATAYLEFIAGQRLKNRELALHILAISARPTLNNATGANKIAAHLQVAQFFIEQSEAECKIQFKDAIRTSNLNYELFLDIGTMLGLDLSLADTTRNLVDERLLKNRNSIAHGEYLVIDQSAYNELHMEVFKLLDLFRNEITNCAIERKYVRA